MGISQYEVIKRLTPVWEAITRQGWMLSIAVICIVAIWFLGGAIGGLVYKLATLSTFAAMGYYVDRAVFPRMRTHILFEWWRDAATPMDRASTGTVLSARLISKAIIVVGIVIAASYVAADPLVPDAARKHEAYLKRAALNLWGPDAPVAALAAQIHAESAWRETAKSWVGARGLAQFMPTTEAAYRARYPLLLGTGDANSPRWAMRAMILYMRDLVDEVGPQRDCIQQYAFALSAYNGGMRWVRARQALSPVPEICLFLTCEINPGIKPPNQRQNEEYPRKILFGLEQRYQIAGFGRPACLS